MRKILPIIFLIGLFISMLASTSIATKPMQLVEPQWGFGTNQFYSVNFDAEGEAEVIAKLSFNNIDKESGQFIIEIPGNNVRMIAAVQEVKMQEQYCSYWKDDCIEMQDRICIKSERICANWYDQQTIKYAPVGFSEEKLSDSSKVTLNIKAPEQEQMTFLIYYKAKGYVDESLNVYNFDFRTIKSSYDVKNVRVAVNVQQGLYLKGTDSNINYQPNVGFDAAYKSVQTSQPEQSAYLSDLSNRVEWQQGFVKQASGLDPWESMSVEGKYSKSKFLINIWSYALWLFLAIVLVLGIRVAYKKLSIKKIRAAQPISHFEMAMIALGSSVLLSIGWWLVVLLMNYLSMVRFNEYLVPPLVIIVILVLLALLLGPSIYIGTTKGARYGFMVFGYTLAWLLMFLVLASALLSISYTRGVYY